MKNLSVSLVNVLRYSVNISDRDIIFLGGFYIIQPHNTCLGASLVIQLVKNPPAMQETLVQFLGQEDPLEKDRITTPVFLGFPGGSDSKESACNVGDLGSIPGLGRSLGEGKGYPLQYSSLENSMNCIVHGVAKSWTQLND